MTAVSRQRPDEKQRSDDAMARGGLERLSQSQEGQS